MQNLKNMSFMRKDQIRTKIIIILKYLSINKCNQVSNILSTFSFHLKLLLQFNISIFQIIAHFNNLYIKVKDKDILHKLTMISKHWSQHATNSVAKIMKTLMTAILSLWYASESWNHQKGDFGLLESKNKILWSIKCCQESIIKK